MKILFPIAVGAVLLLAGCGSNAPLTESECRTLGAKQVDLMMAEVPPEEASRARDIFEKATVAAVGRCTAGQTYNREDYECVMAATTPAEYQQCMD